MEKILYADMCAILFLCCSSSDESEANSQSPFTLPDKAIVLAEQASKSVVILDASTYRTVWSWNPEKAGVFKIGKVGFPPSFTFRIISVVDPPPSRLIAL